MSETEPQRPTNSPKARWAMVALHVAQLVLAIIILGLDAYGLRFVAYNALVFSLVVTITTVLICAYTIAAEFYHDKIYVPWLVILWNIWMIIYWAVDLGVIASLAKLWQGPTCTYDYRSGYVCNASIANITPTTSHATFYGALVAGAVLAAFEFGLWVATTTLICAREFKHSSIDTNFTPAHRASRRMQMTPDTPETPSRRRSSVPAQMQATSSTGTIWDELVPEANRSIPQPLIPEDSESDGGLTRISPSEVGVARGSGRQQSNGRELVKSGLNSNRKGKSSDSKIRPTSPQESVEEYVDPSTKGLRVVNGAVGSSRSVQHDIELDDVPL